MSRFRSPTSSESGTTFEFHHFQRNLAQNSEFRIFQKPGFQKPLCVLSSESLYPNLVQTPPLKQFFSLTCLILCLRWLLAPLESIYVLLTNLCPLSHFYTLFPANWANTHERVWCGERRRLLETRDATYVIHCIFRAAKASLLVFCVAECHRNSTWHRNEVIMIQARRVPGFWSVVVTTED